LKVIRLSSLNTVVSDELGLDKNSHHALIRKIKVAASSHENANMWEIV